MGKMEGQLIAEAAMRPARILVGGMAPDQRRDIVDSITSGGVIAFPQTRMGSESKALSTGTVGGEYSTAQVDLFAQVGAMICTVLGCPPDLIQGGGADTSSKESFRRFALATVAPLLQTVMDRMDAPGRADELRPVTTQGG